MNDVYVSVGPDESYELREQLSPDTRAILDALDRIEALLKEPRNTVNVVTADTDARVIADEVLRVLSTQMGVRR